MNDENEVWGEYNQALTREYEYYFFRPEKLEPFPGFNPQPHYRTPANPEP